MRQPPLRDRTWQLASLVCSLLLGSACSSASDEQKPITSTPQDYCQRACTQAHTCNDATDVVQCESSCEGDLAAQPKLRADFLGYVAGCIDDSACSLTSTAKCKREAQAQLASSTYGQTFCDAFLSAGNQCDPSGATYTKAACFTAAKSYDDSALKTANDCLVQPCTALSACLAQAIPDVALRP